MANGLSSGNYGAADASSMAVQSSQDNLGLQSIATGSYIPPLVPVPNSGGYAPAAQGSQLLSTPVTYDPNPVSPLPSQNTSNGSGTAGSVPQSAVVAPNSSDGSWLSNSWAAVSGMLSTAYNDIAGPETVLGNMPAAIGQTLVTDGQGVVSGVDAGTGAVVSGAESVGSGIVSGVESAGGAIVKGVSGVASYGFLLLLVGIVGLYIVVNGKNPLPSFKAGA